MYWNLRRFNDRLSMRSSLVLPRLSEWTLSEQIIWTRTRTPSLPSPLLLIRNRTGPLEPGMGLEPTSNGLQNRSATIAPTRHTSRRWDLNPQCRFGRPMCYRLHYVCIQGAFFRYSCCICCTRLSGQPQVSSHALHFPGVATGLACIVAPTPTRTWGFGRIEDHIGLRPTAGIEPALPVYETGFLPLKHVGMIALLQ